jgi:hypothetical protein
LSFFFKSNQTHLPTILPFTLNVTHHPSLRFKLLVWTPCLMHRCVCIWRYILQNYNYKLHFQNLSIYHIPDVSIGTLAAENLDVCIACDPWDSNIQLTMGKDQRRQIYVGFVADIDIKILGVIYFCQGFRPCMMPSMDGRRDEWMDGKLHEKRPRRPLLYVLTGNLTSYGIKVAGPVKCTLMHSSF